jgi:integrase
MRTKRGQGRLYQTGHSAFWWMRIGDGRGGEIRQSTGCTDIKAAQQKLAEVRARIAAEKHELLPRIDPTSKNVTIGSLIDAQVKRLELHGARSIASIRSYSKPILATFGAVKVSALTKASVERFQADQKKAGRAHSTINHSVSLLKQSVRDYMSEHKLPAVVFPEKLSERDSVREGFYSDSDTERLIKALPEDLQDFVRFASITGWRKGAVASLRWEAVDREAGVLYLSGKKSKNGSGNTMSLDVEDLGAIIERRSAARAISMPDGTTLISPLVFHRGPGIRRHKGGAQPVMDFDKAYKTACEAVGIKYGRLNGGRTLHCFRRTAARNLRNQSIPESVCMAITGHKTRSMFDRYAIVNSEDIRDAMLKVQTRRKRATPSNVVQLAR